MKRLHYLLLFCMAALCTPMFVVAEGLPSAGIVAGQDAPAYTATVRSGVLELTISAESDQNVVIYALTGQVVKTFTARAGVYTIDLKPGYYIVTVNSHSTRIVVR